jgi:hypothetical protein
MNELMLALADTLPSEVALMAMLLPEGERSERRIRVALHLVLERGGDLAQVMRELDQLAIFLCAHGDSGTGSALLAFGDRLREEADRA